MEGLRPMVNDTHVFSQVWHKVFTTIATLSDPSGKTKWVFSAHPEFDIDETESYPIIVIPSIDISYDPLTFTNIKRGPLTVTIEIYSTNSAQMDTIADNVADKMETSEEAFMASGITVMKLNDTSYDFFSRNSQRVHLKTFTYEFQYGWS